MRSGLLALLTTALVACDAADHAAPFSPEADQPSGAELQAPLRDALERIAPTLGAGPATTALRTALASAVNAPSPAALASVEAALAAVEDEQPDAAVETDVIRLAVTAPH